jgi:hypothetical protein
LTITREDVRSGAKKNANSCAAANALCRQHHCEAAKVHMARAYIKKGKTWVRYAVPPALRSEVLAFDRGGAFAPGEYTLVPVTATCRLGAQKARGANYTVRKSHKNKNIRKRPYHVASGVRARMVDQWWKDQPQT